MGERASRAAATPSDLAAVLAAALVLGFGAERSGERLRDVALRDAEQGGLVPVDLEQPTRSLCFVGVMDVGDLRRPRPRIPQHDHQQYHGQQYANGEAEQGG